MMQICLPYQMLPHETSLESWKILRCQRMHIGQFLSCSCCPQLGSGIRTSQLGLPAGDATHVRLARIQSQLWKQHSCTRPDHMCGILEPSCSVWDVIALGVPAPEACQGKLPPAESLTVKASGVSQWPGFYAQESPPSSSLYFLARPKSMR